MYGTQGRFIQDGLSNIWAISIPLQIKTFVNLKIFSIWIKDTGKCSNQTWEVRSVGAVITKMHPAFNHTISLCKCKWSERESLRVFLPPCHHSECGLVIRPQWFWTQCWHILLSLPSSFCVPFTPVLIACASLIGSTPVSLTSPSCVLNPLPVPVCRFTSRVFHCYFPAGFFPCLACYIGPRPLPPTPPTRLFFLFRFVFLLWLIPALTSIHPLSPPPNHCLFQ